MSAINRQLDAYPRWGSGETRTGKVKLTITILQVQGSVLEAVGACCDAHGKLLFVMEPSKFTTSKDLLDHPPGISHEQIANPV